MSMFKMVTGNNGRSVYYGRITGKNGNEIDIEGVEWNKDTKEEVTRQVHVTVDPDAAESAAGLKAGDAIIFSMLPSRKDPCKGVAEEICSDNSCICTFNENGNEKYIIIGEIKGKKWNEKHNCLHLSFKDIKDFDGNLVGYKRTFTQYGVDWGNSYLNVSFFNNQETKSQSADSIDKRLKIGDRVAMVVSVKKKIYDGKEYTNYYGGRYEIIK